jgi:flavodoxin I
MKAAVVFASTSGSTRAVAALIAQTLAPRPVELVDLRQWARCGDQFSAAAFDLVFLGTPTYGTGDWHFLWERHGEEVLARLHTGIPVALFALGDARGHPRSFAGGLGRLAQQCGRQGLRWVGFSDPKQFAFEASPAIVDGRFPGLVLDYKRQHRLAADMVGACLDRINRDVAGIGMHAGACCPGLSHLERA